MLLNALKIKRKAERLMDQFNSDRLVLIDEVKYDIRKSYCNLRELMGEEAADEWMESITKLPF